MLRSSGLPDMRNISRMYLHITLPYNGKFLHSKTDLELLVLFRMHRLHRESHTFRTTNAAMLATKARSATPPCMPHGREQSPIDMHISSGIPA